MSVVLIRGATVQINGPTFLISRAKLLILHGSFLIKSAPPQKYAKITRGCPVVLPDSPLLSISDALLQLLELIRLESLQQ